MIRDHKLSHSGEKASSEELPGYPSRRLFLLGLFVVSAVVLVGRDVYLQVLNNAFLQEQADKRQVRTVKIATSRGAILDRNGEPLAISIPVDSLWVNPKKLIQHLDQIPRLADALGIQSEKLREKIIKRQARGFYYLQRHANPTLVKKVMALEIPSVHKIREYRRFYPDGEASAQVVGFTNIDDIGQEGVELSFNDLLTGTDGEKRIILDGKRNAVENIESIKEMVPGSNVQLSIDRKIQYLVYRALRDAVTKNKATSASAIILAVDTGEILAMSNYPSFNPNNRDGKKQAFYRNRVVTDVFEPGSTMKPFTVAHGLTTGKYSPNTMIDTYPGYYNVGRLLVKDFRNYGEIDVTEAIKVSSNVAMTKIALSTSPEKLWQLLRDMGFGQATDVLFPGEVKGTLRRFDRWRKVDHATLSYGYGIAVSVLQLAKAYLVLADDGRSKPVSLLKLTQPPEAVPVISRQVARKVRRMMETVVTKHGTGRKAAVEGYHVAGKTGTVKKSVAGGYAKKNYFSVFSGLVPANNPKLVMVVMVDDPKGKDYYGGRVAAPVFADVMKSALRILGIAPDELPENQRIAHGGE